MSKNKLTTIGILAAGTSLTGCVALPAIPTAVGALGGYTAAGGGDAGGMADKGKEIFGKGRDLLKGKSDVVSTDLGIDFSKTSKRPIAHDPNKASCDNLQSLHDTRIEKESGLEDARAEALGNDGKIGFTELPGIKLKEHGVSSASKSFDNAVQNCVQEQAYANHKASTADDCRLGADGSTPVYNQITANGRTVKEATALRHCAINVPSFD